MYGPHTPPRMYCTVHTHHKQLDAKEDWIRSVGISSTVPSQFASIDFYSRVCGMSVFLDGDGGSVHASVWDRDAGDEENDKG